ncbi:MAG: AAA family ATPase [Ferrimicrobium sp.]
MRDQDKAALDTFLDNPIDRPLLGLVYGRRRIGKSTMLVEQAERRGGFYFEAIRAETPVQLERLGTALGEHLGVGRLALNDWEAAVGALLRLGERSAIPVILDEFGHIIAADPSVESVLTTTLGPGALRKSASKARLILCGSAIAMMRALTEGEAPLRGRAGLELIMQPDDFRVAATRLPKGAGFETAVRVFAVIGGVVGYATDMVNFDLPNSRADIDRWIVERILSPAATLQREATTLLAEDPSLSGKNNLLHHSILGAIANGSVTAGTIANKVGRQVSNIDLVLRRLIESGFIVRHEDPIRRKRPLYALADSFLQFHYAVIEPYGATLRERDLRAVWSGRLGAVFSSRVRGPVFEEMTRKWATNFASETTLPIRDHVGPSFVSLDGVDHELDVLVTYAGDVPSDRGIVALGEAKSGEVLTTRHLQKLERAKTALGANAARAKLLLFGERVDERLAQLAAERDDVEVVDLDRLYTGS